MLKSQEPHNISDHNQDKPYALSPLCYSRLLHEKQALNHLLRLLCYKFSQKWWYDTEDWSIY